MDDVEAANIRTAIAQISSEQTRVALEALLRGVLRLSLLMDIHGERIRDCESELEIDALIEDELEEDEEEEKKE